jgi:hypothetical protein
MGIGKPGKKGQTRKPPENPEDLEMLEKSENRKPGTEKSYLFRGLRLLHVDFCDLPGQIKIHGLLKELHEHLPIRDPRFFYKFLFERGPRGGKFEKFCGRGIFGFFFFLGVFGAGAR